MVDIKTPLESLTTNAWLETHRDPFVLIDANYTIVAANSAYAQAYGADSSSIVGRKCHEVSHRSAEPCHRRGENCPHQAVFATRRPAQVVHVHFDVKGRAERVRLSAAPIILPDGSMLMSESVRVLTGESAGGPHEMVGASPAYLDMLSQLAEVAPSNLPVLLTGETGAGKELAAQFLHRQSSRQRGPLVVIDCTSIPESLFEAELFGHEKGAFTGPTSRRIGLAEEASGGTLFLDEIGELPLSVQAKLLRFAETGEVRRLGANQTRHVDCRIISATHRPLSSLIDTGRFRRDLYYRLAGIEIRVPALLERGDDVLLIAEAMLHRIPGGRRCTLSEPTRQCLRAHAFPGNVRELRNAIQRAAQRAGGGQIEPWHLGLDTGTSSSSGLSGERAQPLPPSNVPLGPRWAVRHHTSAGEAVKVVPGIPSGDPSAAPMTRPQSLAEQVALLCASGLSRRTVAERLGMSERTIYRHLAKLEQQSSAVPSDPAAG
ncbi:MAG: sigma 54-interacting transcriptional regulator [Gammaproteobacteria bacterium]